MQTPHPSSSSLSELSQPDLGFTSFLSSNEEKWKFWDSVYALHFWSPRSWSPLLWMPPRVNVQPEAEAADFDIPEFREDSQAQRDLRRQYQMTAYDNR
ncbi:hypothetical protein VNI00_012102 [Paramarasmius palmivorus]|uniref:Uncharacterized protein n=1 Tax=Paramarasmius palmivorus TaxID=297713 RepID=A0AAW0C7G7_9AGAR